MLTTAILELKTVTRYKLHDEKVSTVRQCERAPAQSFQLTRFTTVSARYVFTGFRESTEISSTPARKMIPSACVRRAQAQALPRLVTAGPAALSTVLLSVVASFNTRSYGRAPLVPFAAAIRAGCTDNAMSLNPASSQRAQANSENIGR
ncbi:hypothetical protein EVAR_83659_1 [Eumeta japonica]|uniref:Uncharacterized protein n=1 Tax=Eumeta variegata TaxID=151549 RepID=A0A4C1UNI5_EUMVA|nr:hypothetical protein EVAR_83659_1 [Eumeta japonica]